MSSRAPKRCFYDKHRQRLIPSKKALETLSQSLEECRSVLKRLYPKHEVSALLPLSRQELLGLLEQPAENSATTLPSPPLNTSINGDESESSLADLEQIPSPNAEWDEERRERDSIPPEADDVNALSLSVDRQASYLGASSIKAALMVMLKVHPGLRDALETPLSTSKMPHNYPCIRQQRSTCQDPKRIPQSWRGQSLIDAYFKRIHVFIPMLDEAAFRADYVEGQRVDASWLALLNMVFAMGSIVAVKSSDHKHVNYYNRAMEYLPMDAFGSSRIETVQALALIGGYYLHYVNRPNMANAVLGAAIRMASALGLHRESIAHTHNDFNAAETRRRTWWSLFCLDTWATTTMGRPSFGRWGPAIDISPPEFGVSNVAAANGSSRDGAEHAGIMPLVENIKFCKIATQAQDLLAVSPLLPAEKRYSIDGQLVSWYASLPWLLRATEPCAEPLYSCRCIMKWRYQNLRMLLHRPVLLNLASSNSTCAPECDIASVEMCRELARQTINDIAREWTRNQMSGWNAAWFLYQAAMIPLVSLFWESKSPSVPDWYKQLKTVLQLLEAMEDWSLAARRSREVTWKMYEAARKMHGGSGSPPAVPSSFHAGQAREASGSGIPAINNAVNDMVVGKNELYTSPVGLECESLGMPGTLDQQGLWDIDLLQYWNEAVSGEPPSADIEFSSTYGLEGLVPMGYEPAMMGVTSHPQAATEGGFTFIR